MGLGGRFNAFLSTIVSVTVFNIALISTLCWLPTIVGNLSITFRENIYGFIMMIVNGICYIYNLQFIQGIVIKFQCDIIKYIIPMIFNIIEFIEKSLNLEMDWNLYKLIFSKIYKLMILKQSSIYKYIINYPMLLGYIVLITACLIALCLDFAYYYCKRPKLVKKRRKYLETKSTKQIHSFWVLCEEISRFHTVFWRFIDSVLRVIDFLFQLMIVPYVFGRGIDLATKCVRDEATRDINVANDSDIFFKFLDGDNLTMDDGEFMDIIETSISYHMSYWIVGFWYIYGAMKIFSLARHLMRIEFNSCWMRFPQPNQTPMSLSIFRAMKERLISMRMHIPLIFMGIHIPCKIMYKLFPSIFPIILYPCNLHKWTTAGMLFMISCSLATIFRRIRFRQRWNNIARYWLDTVCFALGIRYLIIPGSQPPHDVLLEVNDPDAQKLLFDADDDGDGDDGDMERELLQNNDTDLKENDDDDDDMLQDNDRDLKEDDEDQEIKKEEEKEYEMVKIKPSASLLGDVPVADDGNEWKEEIKILKEKKEKLHEENEWLKKKIKILEKKKVNLNIGKNNEKNKKKKKEKRGDDIFLKRHPWVNPHDIYLTLQEDRILLQKRCKLYTINVTHLRLRIFLFIICLWITHTLSFLIGILIPLIIGRFMFYNFCDNVHVDLFSNLNNNVDIISYTIGCIICIIIPNEIYITILYHLRGTLFNAISKFLIRLFIFVFTPLYIGYGWNVMIYHFIQSTSVTPIYCLLEILCTGIYITIIYLLFQKHDDLQRVLRWIQINNNNNVNLKEFFYRFALPILYKLILHISLPIAIRYWTIKYYHNNLNNNYQINNDSMTQSIIKQTVVIDINLITNKNQINLLQQSILKLKPILLNKVFLHYNTYELSLFLSCDIWSKLFKFIFKDYNLNILLFLRQPYFTDTLILNNGQVIIQFFKFIINWLIIKAPIPLFAIIKLILIAINNFIKNLPKIKNKILQEKYVEHRRLANFYNDNKKKKLL